MYYRFSRRRKNYLRGNYEYLLRRKKSDYMINTGRSKILDSFFFENQVWGALHKACKGYVIAKNKNEDDKMVDYADIIQECQDDLWLKVSSFNNIGKSALAFYSSRAWQYLCPRTQTCASRLENLLSRRLDFSRV